MSHDEAIKLLDVLDAQSVGVDFYGTGQPEALLTALQVYFLNTTRAALMDIINDLKRTDDATSISSKLLNVVLSIDSEPAETLEDPS